MLIHEHKETHNHIETETRVYLDVENKNVEYYQYQFYEDKVLDINCINIPMVEFGKLTKVALHSYILLTQTHKKRT